MRECSKLASRLMLGIAAAATVLVAACGGGGGGGFSGFIPPPTSNNPPANNPPVTPPPSPPIQQKAASAEVEYASVAAIPLSSIEASSNITAGQVQFVSGPASNLTVTDGEIRFITPSDPGTDGTVSLTIQDGDTSIALTVVVRSSRPTSITQTLGTSEDGTETDQSTSQLIVTGLGEGNALMPAELKFTANDAPAFDPDASSASIFAPATGQVFGVSSVWQLDAATNTFIVPATAVTQLLGTLPSGELTFSVGLASADGQYAQNWTFIGYKPSATLNIQVVDFSGAANASAAGKLLAVRGSSNRVRIVIPVDSQGQAQVTNLPAGTFEISVLDVQQPGFWTATVPIFVGSTSVNATLLYAPDGSGAAGTSQKPGATRTVTGVQQDGATPPAREISGAGKSSASQKATPSSCETVGSTPGESSYEAIADAQAATISCVASHTLPQGTKRAGVTIIVSTEEYPVFTTAKSQYNDSWSYAVGLGGVGSASGLVNDSHYTQGTTTKKACVDVSTLTQNGPYTFNASMSATNVGDSNLPTVVHIDVKPSCDGDLKVTSANFASPNKKVYNVVKPLPEGANLPGHYVSLPTTKDFSDWGIPLTVKFDPPDVTITSARIGVMVGSTAQMSDVDVLPMVTQKTAGSLTFSELRMPRLPINQFAGKTNVVIELTGTTAAGATVRSKAEDGPIKFKGDSSYFPLFDLGSLLPGRRYGSNTDPGGDAWATMGTYTWLSARSYRFDDISALHVATKEAKSPKTGNLVTRSVLGHSGHSDGCQIDLRYADGSGGFTDALGGSGSGASIQAMLDAAAAESAANGSKGVAQIKASIAWINANRTMIQNEASGASKIYFGKSFIQLALVSGKFPDGSPVPLLNAQDQIAGALGKWTNKPDIAGPAEDHLHHWHISLKSQ